MKRPYQDLMEIIDDAKENLTSYHYQHICQQLKQISDEETTTFCEIKFNVTAIIIVLPDEGGIRIMSKVSQTFFAKKSRNEYHLPGMHSGKLEIGQIIFHKPEGKDGVCERLYVMQVESIED